MSSARCIAAMTNALGREPTAAELEQVVERIERRMTQRRRARDGKTDAQLYREAAAELAPEIRAAAYFARRSRLLNIQARENARARAETFAASRMEGLADNPYLAVESLDVGINYAAPGARDSVEKRHKGMFFEYTVGGIMSDLYREGRDLVNLFGSREMELPIRQELREMSNAAVGEAANVGVSGNAEALKIARIIRKWQTIARNRENAAGSWRGEVWGFTTGHGWQSRLVWRTGKEEFVNDMLRTLDPRTYERQQSRLDEIEAKSFAAAATWDLAYQEFKRANKELAAVSGKLRRAYDVVDVSPEKLDALDKVAQRMIGAQQSGDLRGIMDALAQVDKVRSQVIGRARGATKRLTQLEPDARNLVQMIDRVWDHMRKAEQQIRAAHDVSGKMDARIDDTRAFLEAAFDDIVTDRWLVSDGARADFDGNLPFIGPGNLAERVSRHRVFHFKSADAELEMIRKYGAGDLRQQVISEMDHTARNTALMQIWGTNPERNRAEFINELLDKHHGDPAKTGPLQAPWMDNLYAQISGEANTLAKGRHASWMASWGQGVRAYNVISLLGNMIMAQFGDVAMRGREMRYQGHGLFSAYAKSVESLFEGLSSEERKRVGRSMGVGFDGMLGWIYSRFADQDATPGKMAKLQGLFYKAFGASYWTDAMKRGQAFQTAFDYAQIAGRGWDALDVEDRRLLELYGFNGKAWDVIRSALPDDAGKGVKMLTPDSIGRLELEAFMDYAGSADWRVLVKAQNDLALKWRMMIMDRADIAVPGPDARTRALALGDSQRGSFEGEIRRLLFQFKGFPLGVIFNALGREWYGRAAEAPHSKYVAVVETMVVGGIMGYLSLVASDMQKGYWPPRDPMDPRTWIASFQRGGGFGIYGDVLFGEYHDFGRTLSSTLLGPTIGGIGDPVAKMIAKTIRFAASGGDAQYNPGYDAYRFAVSHLPVLNMHVVKPTVDYLFMRDIAERVNPGAQRRMEQRREREWGQRMYDLGDVFR